jgi:primosomal protein N' (replication factor Y)
VIASLKRQAQKVPLQTVLKEAQVGAATLITMEKKGIVSINSEVVRRDPFYDSQTQAPSNYTLTAAQSSVLTEIESAIQNGTYSAFLLHGVTGSGKTEVYIRAMERVRDLGRQSLIVAPEISLTPQLLDRLSARFPKRVGVLHSGLTGAQRWAQWRQIADGQVDVVVGARSAVFAPIHKLGLIVVD